MTGFSFSVTVLGTVTENYKFAESLTDFTSSV
jgi:hypothetical protein